MQFDRTILDRADAHATERINGTLPNGKPFEAFLLRMDRARTRLTVAHGGHPRTVSQFTTSADAFAGVNGGFYVTKTGSPLDWLEIDRRTVSEMSLKERPCLFLRPESAAIGFPHERADAPTVLQAGPQILRGGEILTDYAHFSETAYQFDGDITKGRAPRTVFGIGKSRYFFLVVDGRSSISAGLRLEECAELGQALGIRDAINLDGGGSSALVVRSRLLNNPRASAKQRVPAERAIPAALLAFLG